ncbi:Golgi to ER traffic protein 4 homolog [Dysidea avara]|uniref:Golgi to ER traffic protein 4 homolog n=1 Tax=Dysidea avara TaxID=196820 RepID=UPI00332EBD79
METRSRGRNVGTRKVSDKLSGSIQKGNYYEAHQLCRTLYQRYKVHREGEAIDVLHNGTVQMLKNAQWESATDLGMLLIKHFKERKTPFSDHTMSIISDIFYLYDPAEKGRDTFMKASLKWSSMVCEEHKYGHPRIHQLVASTYWKEKDYARARDHFLYASKPEEYGSMLVEFACKKGYPSEADLFITQAVLQLLVLQCRHNAITLYTIYTESHPSFSSKKPPYKKEPLMNFVWFLLQASEHGDTAVFLCLRQKYHPALQRDPSFSEYLDKIGTNFFGVAQSATAKPGNVLGNLLSGLMDSLTGATNSAGPAVLQPKPPLDASQEELD